MMRLRPLLLAVLAAGAAACGADPTADEAGADVAPIIQPTVHVLDADYTLDGSRVLVAKDLAKDLASRRPGDVLVSQKGLLRRVRGVTTEGDNVVVDTEPASLEDVFHQVHVGGTIDPDTQDTPPQQVGALAPQAFTLKLAPISIKNKRLTIGDGCEIELVDGTFSFRPDVDFDLTMHNGHVDHLKVLASGESHTTMHVRYAMSRPPNMLSGAYVRLDDGYPIAETAPSFAVFWAGPVPVVVSIKARFLVNWEVLVGGDLSGDQSFHGDGSASLGLELRNGQWTNLSARSLSVGLDGVSNLASHALVGDVTLTARLDVSLYELAGPYVGLQTYAGLGHRGDVMGNEWYAQAGIRGLVGAQASVFGKALVGYQSVLFDVGKQVPIP